MADPYDHITRIAPASTEQPFEGLCGLCGLAVVDVGVHAAWHQAIRDVVTEMALTQGTVVPTNLQEI